MDGTVVFFTFLLSFSSAGAAFLLLRRSRGSPQRHQPGKGAFTGFIPLIAILTAPTACLVPPIIILLPILGAAAFFLLRDVVRRGRSRADQRHARRELPTLIDTLVLKVEAGQALIPSFLEAREILEPRGPLCRAIECLGNDLRLGTSRIQALKALRDSSPGPETGGFIDALLQAIELGTPVGRILREQSVRMREHLLMEGERFANTLSLKLLGPLFLFIFPAAFLLILSPVVIALFRDRAW